MFLSGLYPYFSFKFCNISDVTSCAASTPPLAIALVTLLDAALTTSGPTLFTRSDIKGTCIAFTKRPRGNISIAPAAATAGEKVAEVLCSSVASAARARSLASPAAALKPNTPAIPVPTAAAAVAGNDTAATRAGAINAAAEPSPPAILPQVESGSTSGLRPLATL